MNHEPATDPVGGPSAEEGAQLSIDDPDQYRQAIAFLASALRTAWLQLSLVPLDKLERAVAHADSVGWALDPTAYRDALQSGGLEAQRVLLRWARETRKTTAELARVLGNKAPG